MARIRRLDIRNFRSIKSLEWAPSAGINRLIGPGDSGKSSILDSIDLCLGARRTVGLADTDFYGLVVTEPIVIAVTLEALDEQMGKLMRMKARLAARTEPKPDDQRPVRVVDDQASDMLLWRRPQPEMLKGAVSARLAKPGGLEASPQPDNARNGSLPARRRPGR